MFVYKLRHKSTGLYFVPGKENLSKVGKLYSRHPSLTYTNQAVHDKKRLGPDEFEIVTFELAEVPKQRIIPR